MYLASNTSVYEVARAPIEQTLESAGKFGFTYVEYAAYQGESGSGDLIRVTAHYLRRCVPGAIIDLLTFVATCGS